MVEITQVELVLPLEQRLPIDASASTNGNWSVWDSTLGFRQAIILQCPYEILVAGQVNLRGDATESIGGWKLGYIQLLFLETNVARFRGRTVRDGSILVNRSHGLSRDTASSRSGHLWYVHPEELRSQPGNNPAPPPGEQLSALLTEQP